MIYNGLIHRCLKIASAFQYFQFKKLLRNPRKAQEIVLNTYLARLEVQNYSEFCKRYPITRYQDIERSILQQMEQGDRSFIDDVIRFEPTSGSVGAIKWIPYTTQFCSELDKASSPWLYDLYRKYPLIGNGKHYWSLSWLPNDLREKASNNETEIFPWYKKIVLSHLMAINDEVVKKETSQEAIEETLYYLCKEDISLFSFWSPTLILSLLENLFANKEVIVARLESSKPDKAAILSKHKELTKDFTKEMWPNLNLISAWGTSTSRQWADVVTILFPHANFQGKGLWATEGVITIPFEGKYPLAINSHFYEFQCLETSQVLCSWELKAGQIVKPILTTGSGLTRYILDDKIKVESFMGQTPCFEFLGRDRVSDFVGEKLDFDLLEKLSSKIASKLKAKFITVLFHNSGKKYYELLVESKNTFAIDSNDFEEDLMKVYHYRLARELEQLGEAKIKMVSSGVDYYYEKCHNEIKGNIKFEIVMPVYEDKK